MPSKERITLPKGTKVPNHVAIIPDGNRRWARARGLNTLKGHKAGFERAVDIAKAARDIGIHTMTLWGFSTENWDRTEEEINYLMKLYHKLLDDYLKEAHKDKVRIHHLGRKDRLPTSLIKKIENAESETKNYSKYIANIGLDYGGQDDILRSVQTIIKAGIPAEKVDADLFTKYTDLHDQPYPYVDLMIRTSGEQRTSGFLLWQSAYTEYYWENDHFPDFTPEKLKAAVLDYSRRRRRFGGNDAEEHLKFRPEMSAKLELAWWRLRKIPEGTRFRDYAIQHLKEQFGLSKDLAIEAGLLLTLAVLEGNENKWEKAKRPLKKFYKLIKEELKLAFEPSLATSLEVKLWQDLSEKESMEQAVEVEETARQYYAEVYRISLFQAAKAAHLRVLASVERNLAERGFGEHHWAKAEDYLQKFYSALKERVA
ncbi:di-trans,poly-cis-decaprenylcistransferase [Candidatus Woesebacteria bacterium RIFCSPLOWO2_01_FULL_39_61]|uniref:Isoprenyl transferase n=2 Tax=Microgenomates group TaxID=1794810 RepID=A0A0H4T862_9BACT|nr:undecaprenyl diphosphate synthase, undecaprenyl diphosphate synthase [uncultured Microgenomates bacterium Rifle_16ft_4_minimus_37836]OGM28057.1 MAG: di-trans,poly-cis-decaprenylcistransferase [Candidatus Woesebacteria bacterium RIFCSPHIGHO2_01_FULL_39_95]OGM34045.1 MAG: di-trans,poly-cis-decaprenylcistransferase [Candidatus Woesebacteria bacterium RIFCSPHIGHO2_02_FULL_39_13]OGM38303.1 MAG: di-trans,poly-cis-decaprenylcistransferase [Candidatus Woesebacteria bacterium RIFCSPHIGHO2_12_FULL_40_2